MQQTGRVGGGAALPVRERVTEGSTDLRGEREEIDVPALIIHGDSVAIVPSR
jgi:pimeloyl-ACP methyl ester carboxylesterase